MTLSLFMVDRVVIWEWKWESRGYHSTPVTTTQPQSQLNPSYHSTPVPTQPQSPPLNPSPNSTPVTTTPPQSPLNPSHHHSTPVHTQPQSPLNPSHHSRHRGSVHFEDFQQFPVRSRATSPRSPTPSSSRSTD